MRSTHRPRPQRRSALRGALRSRHARDAAARRTPAAGAGRGHAGRRGSPLPLALGHRSDRDGAGDVAQRRRARSRRGRLDADPAGGEAAARSTRAAGRRHAAPARMGIEDRGGDRRAAPRASAVQGGHPRAVSEPRAVRQPDRRRRARQPRLFRQRQLDADAGAGRVPGGAAAASVALQPVAQPGAGDGAAAGGAGADGTARLPAGSRCRGRAGRTAPPGRRRRAVPGASLRRHGARRSARPEADACGDDARCRAAAHHRRHRPQPAAAAREARRDERRDRRARQHDVAVAGVGRIGQLRRRSRRIDQRTDVAAPARLGAEALHLRARVRIGREPGDGAARRAGELPHRGGRRDLHAAQLRRAVPRTAAGAGRAGRLDQRAGGVAGLRPRRRQRAALPAPGRFHDVRQDRGPLRPRAHARQRRGAPRRAHRRLRRVRPGR